MRSLALLLLLLLPASAADVRGPDRRKLAGLVVRSEDYEIQRGAEVVEVFRGSVSYRQRGREFYADWAERRHSNDRMKARGRVRAVWKHEDGTVSEARGHEAQHDGDAETGWMRPKPGEELEFERRESADAPPDQGRAKELRWDSKAQTLRLDGDVRTWGPSGRSWAEHAEFFQAQSRLVLTGRRPVLETAHKDWFGAVQAERIEAKDDPRTVNADGKVRGWFVFKDREEALRGL